MRVSRLFQSLLSVSLAASLMVLSFSSVQALERVRWKMQSAWGSQVKILGETGLYISDTIKTISDNKIQLRFHEPNSLVPVLEMWDAVKQGSLDAAFTTPGYHAGKIIPVTTNT